MSGLRRPVAICLSKSGADDISASNITRATLDIGVRLQMPFRSYVGGRVFCFLALKSVKFVMAPKVYSAVSRLMKCRGRAQDHIVGPTYS